MVLFTLFLLFSISIVWSLSAAVLNICNILLFNRVTITPSPIIAIGFLISLSALMGPDPLSLGPSLKLHTAQCIVVGQVATCMKWSTSSSPLCTQWLNYYYSLYAAEVCMKLTFLRWRCNIETLDCIEGFQRNGTRSCYDGWDTLMNSVALITHKGNCDWLGIWYTRTVHRQNPGLELPHTQAWSSSHAPDLMLILQIDKPK